MADLLWDNPAVSGESQMPLSESDTRAKLLDPALHACGWTEDLLRREETAGAIEIVAGAAAKAVQGTHRLHPPSP